MRMSRNADPGFRQRLRQLGQKTISPWKNSVFSKHEKHVVTLGRIQKKAIARFIELVHGQLLTFLAERRIPVEALLCLRDF
jgi:hypothetical protein